MTYEKTIEFYETYEKKVTNFIIAYEKALISSVLKYRKIVFGLIKGIQLCFNGFVWLIQKVYKAARYLTFPMHWIWILVWLKKISESKDDFMSLPFNKTGAHFYTGPPGCGKSTFVYHKNLERAYITGKTAYTTVQMEEPRIDFDGTKYVYNQVFNPSDIFQDGQQIQAWDYKRHDVIVYEELLTMYNHRNNNKADYKSEVIPMITSLGTVRHQQMEIFDFISQLPKTDIQIMQMIKYYHEPRIKKVFDYKNWLLTGKFRLKIKGWKLTSYQIINKSNNDYELLKIKSYFYPATLEEDMKYFRKLNMKQSFAELPVYEGVKMK